MVSAKLSYSLNPCSIIALGVTYPPACYVISSLPESDIRFPFMDILGRFTLHSDEGTSRRHRLVDASILRAHVVGIAALYSSSDHGSTNISIHQWLVASKRLAITGLTLKVARLNK